MYSTGAGETLLFDLSGLTGDLTITGLTTGFTLLNSTGNCNNATGCSAASGSIHADGTGSWDFGIDCSSACGTGGNMPYTAHVKFTIDGITLSQFVTNGNGFSFGSDICTKVGNQWLLWSHGRYHIRQRAAYPRSRACHALALWHGSSRAGRDGTPAPQGHECIVEFSCYRLQTAPSGAVFFGSNSALVRRSLAATMEAEEVLLPWQVFGDRAVHDIRFALEPAPSIDHIGAVWRRLDDAGQTSFFVSWTWIGTWLRCLPESVRPLLLTASCGGETMAAAILVPRRERRRLLVRVRQLHFNSTGDPKLDGITIEHNDFACGAGANPTLWPALLGWFAGGAIKDVDELVVPGAIQSLDNALPRGTRLLHRTAKSPAFACALPEGGVEAILDGLSSNARQQLRHSLRDCTALGELRCDAASSVENALAWFDALKALHVASWTKRGKPHGFRYPFFETFHRALIEHAFSGRSVQLLRISAGDHALGYLYNVSWRGDCISAYQSGFDDSRRELRPGYVSHVLAMAAGAGDGATRYDFLAGDNQLKRSLGLEHYALYSHRFAKPNLGLRIEAGFKSARNRFGF